MKYFRWIYLSLFIATWTTIAVTFAWDVAPTLHKIAFAATCVLAGIGVYWWAQPAELLPARSFKAKPCYVPNTPPQYVWDDFSLAWLETRAGLHPCTTEDWAEVIKWLRENLHLIDELGWPKSAQEDLDA